MRGVKEFLVVLLLAFFFREGLCEEDSALMRQRRYTGPGGTNISAILDSLLTGYDKRVRPNYWGEPVEVGISMHFLSIRSLSDDKMEFTFDFYFRQHWNDPRLAFNSPGVSKVILSSDFLSQIWLPDIFFPNERKSFFHTVTTSNELIRVTGRGDVLRSVRLSITSSCPMDFHYFPMDSQLCGLEIESFGYSMRHLVLKWHSGKNSIAVEPSVSLPNFRVKGYNFKTIISSTSTGNYSRLLAEIGFTRSSSYYITMMYVPSAMIVIVSWVTLWLNKNDIDIRILISIISLFSLTFLSTMANATLPKVAYTKSIDIYHGVCAILLFAVTIEHALVDYISKKARAALAQEKEAEGSVGERSEVDYSLSPIDLIARSLFPIVFGLFNIIYFVACYSVVEDLQLDSPTY